MGLTFFDLEIASPADLTRWERLEFLIDSGAIYSVVPSGLLERLGIQPVTEQEFRPADGCKITRKKGIAAFRYG